MRKGFLLILVGGSCALFVLQAHGGRLERALKYSGIYSCETNRFVQAWLFKPNEPKSADMTFSLAPLIIQQMSDPGPATGVPDRFGEMCANNGALHVVFMRPVVYSKTDAVELNGRTHARFSYLWFYSGDPAPGPTEALSVQGIRLTLDSSGRPVIWEVPADNAGIRLIFVAQSVETGALKDYGQPFPGRQHSVERSLQQAPGVVVARVIDDAPVAMGPIIYLNARSRVVSTLICRCMPAQAERLVGTSGYDLVPTDGSPVTQALTMQAKDKRNSMLWRDSKGHDPNLEQLLRLPRSL